MNRLLVPTPKPRGSIRPSLAIIRSIQLVSALASLLLARPLLATPAPIDFDTARGAREVGMGGTFRELGIGANSADGNPAAMALFQAFQLEFAGGYDWKAKGWYAAGWARDSTNQELAGAYSLHYISNDYGAGTIGARAHPLSPPTRRRGE